MGLNPFEPRLLRLVWKRLGWIHRCPFQREGTLRGTVRGHAYLTIKGLDCIPNLVDQSRPKKHAGVQNLRAPRSGQLNNERLMITMGKHLMLIQAKRYLVGGGIELGRGRHWRGTTKTLRTHRMHYPSFWYGVKLVSHLRCVIGRLSVPICAVLSFTISCL